MRKRLVGLLIVALLAGFAWWQREQLLMRLPGVLGRILNPIGETEPVVWQPGPTRSERRKGEPNIVLIVVDDLGYADLGFSSASAGTDAGAGVADGAVPTPNIDSIARDGIQFSQGYTGNATCSPSRAAILTCNHLSAQGS